MEMLYEWKGNKGVHSFSMSPSEHCVFNLPQVSVRGRWSPHDWAMKVRNTYTITPLDKDSLWTCSLLHFYRNLLHLLTSDLSSQPQRIDLRCLNLCLFWILPRINLNAYVTPYLFFIHTRCTHMQKKKRKKSSNQHLFSVLKFCWSFLVFGRGEVVLAGIYQNYWFSISSHVLQETDGGGEGEGPQALHEVFKGRL